MISGFKIGEINLTLSFEKLIQSQYYNELYMPIDKYISRNAPELYVKSHVIDDITSKRLEDFRINRVLSRKIKGDFIESELQIITELELKGRTKYGYESDSGELWLRVTVLYKLDNGLKDFTVTQIIKFNSSDYVSDDLGLTPEFVPYLRAKELDKVAEDILRKYYPAPQ